jgi:pSer/pThr/pTyr-binding forkhead associated (FHA) protein
MLELSEDGGLALSDRSANGTFLNGKRLGAGTVHSGDTLRLGADGPELRIRLTQEFAATVLSEKPQADATVLQASAAGRETAGWIADPPPAPDAKPVRVALGEAPKPEMLRGASTPSPARPATLEVGDQQAMDKKLDSIRNLLAANLAVMVILLLAVLYQGQQINKNREALTGMHQEAQNAVKTFTPALDQRLKVMEQRMDGFDGKMKQAEDRFVERMNKELPSVMDKYINRKFEELRRQAGK